MQNMYPRTIEHSKAILLALNLVASQLCCGAVLADPTNAPSGHNRVILSTYADSAQHPAIGYSIDLGYLQLEAETCLPLGPAQQTIARMLASNRPLSTADAATLTFSWRQIQHHRAAAGPASSAVMCYYIAH